MEEKGYATGEGKLKQVCRAREGKADRSC